MRVRTAALSVAVAALLTVGATVPACAESDSSRAGRTSAPDTSEAGSESEAGGVNAAGAGIFRTYGDKVHVSSSKPRTASAHGWWRKFSGPGSKAKVTVWLQVRTKSGKKWHTVAKGVKNIKSAKSRSRKPSTTARKGCNNHKTRQWRSLIDVDIIGVGDSPEKAYTKTVKLRCGV
ncbi:hypothetical protein [Streptomyces sp. WMMB303]|uniref:hypothetical protein n=1 Tax=Streptomyces sp. WMMB303 TaxID=3034154 RepID=UPI0023EBD5E0|nr:hypothetical protein [Streptomyces sp. WMMB303]MDF4253295.1 hypothetical protein [Streptomyces sp. WMMB303]